MNARWRLLGCIVVLATSAGTDARGQATLPADDEGERLLALVDHAAGKRDWSRAIESLELLYARIDGGKLEAGLYEPKGGGPARALDDALIAALRRWPRAGQRAFRFAFEGRARQLLGRAAGSGDRWRAARFLLTEAAGLALERLASDHLERGQAALALRALRWAEGHPDDPFDPDQLRAMRALCWIQLGRPDRVARLAATSGDRPLRLGGERLTLRQAAARWRAAAPAESIRASRPATWLQPDARADRSQLLPTLAHAGGPRRWRSALELESSRRAGARRAAGLRPHRSDQALHDGARAYVIGPAGVAAYQLEDGALRWAFPELGPRSADDPDPRPWAGQLSGELLIVTLGDGLFAIDAASGRVRWQFEPRTLASDHPLAGISTLSAPLVVGRRVWVCATRVGDSGELLLLGFDRQRGGEPQARLLASNATPTRLGFSAPPAPPTLVGGSLWVAQLGALLALDPADGSPRLGARYPRYPQRQLAAQVAAARTRPPAPVRRLGSLLLLCPSDSPDVFAVDQIDAAVAWRHPLAPGDRLLACGRGRVLIGQPGGARLLDSRGRVVWSQVAAGAGARPGAALIGHGELLLAYADRIERRGLARGRLRGRRWLLGDGAVAPRLTPLPDGGLLLVDDRSLSRLDRPGPARTPAERARSLAWLPPAAARETRDALLATLTPDAPAAEPLRAALRHQLDRARGGPARLAALGRLLTITPPSAARAALLRQRCELSAAAGALDREALAELARQPQVTTPSGAGLPGSRLAQLLDRQRPLPAEPSATDLLAAGGDRDAGWLRALPVSWRQRRLEALRGLLGELAAGAPARAAAPLTALLRLPSGTPLPSRRGRLRTVFKTTMASAGPVARLHAPIESPSARLPFPVALSGEHCLQLRDAVSGALIWQSRERLDFRAVGAAGPVALIVLERGVLAIDPGDGRERWWWSSAGTRRDEAAQGAWRQGGERIAAVALTPAAVVVASGRALVALDPTTAEVRWQRELPGPVSRDGLLVVGDQLMAHAHGALRAFALADGTPGPQLATAGRLRQLSRLADGQLALLLRRQRRPTSTRALLIESAGLRQRVEIQLGGGDWRLLTGDVEQLAFTSNEVLDVFGLDGRRRWRGAPLEGLRAAVAGGEVVFAGSRGRDLVARCRRLRDGAVRWQLRDGGGGRIEAIWACAGPRELETLLLLRRRGALRAMHADGGRALVPLTETGHAPRPSEPADGANALRDAAAVGPTWLCLAADGLRGLSGRQPEAAACALYRDWPRRADPLVGPRVARWLAEARALPEARGLLERLAADDGGDWPIERRWADLLQGLAELLGDRRQDRRQLIAARMEQAPAIDGRLDDRWSRAHRITLAGPRDLRLLLGPEAIRPQGWRPWRGHEDHRADLYLGWDERYFYAALRIEDHRNTRFAEDARRRWVGDVVFFAFDPLDNGGYRYRHGEDYAFWLFNPRPRSQPKPKPKPRPRPQPRPDQPPELESKTSIRWVSSTVRVVEVALPWSKLIGARGRALEPRPGLRFGLEVLALDDDSGRGATRGLATSTGFQLSADGTREGQDVIKRFWPQRFAQVELQR